MAGKAKTPPLRAVEVAAVSPAPHSPARELMPIVMVGHVDHGKSTLVGRLIHDTGAMPEGKLEELRAVSEKRGVAFEWAFLLDALQAERDQGVTIDAAHVRFATQKRDYVIIDAPGHREFIRNMVTGASWAAAAVLVIDAAQGVREQTLRHGYLLHMLGVRQVAVVVNKMDLVDHAQARFDEVARECRDYLARIGMHPTHFIPVSAHEGHNVVTTSGSTDWYEGPSVTGALDGFVLPATLSALPLRFPLQDVYKFDDRRILAGRIESGHLRVGDVLLFSPSNKTARVASIEAWGAASAPVEAAAGCSVGITLDEQIFVERGELASHRRDPPVETNVFHAHLFWLGAEPLTVGARYKMRLGTSEAEVEVQAIERVIDTRDLGETPADKVERDGVARVVLRSRAMLALDEFSQNPHTGRFVLVDGHYIAGGGTISMESYPDQRGLVTQKATNITAVDHKVVTDARSVRNGHKGGVLWFTGLSGAGKSTLAVEVEQMLFRKGYQVYVLDGDNVRHGLNANLGFSPEDRAENIRRVGEVSALFADAGFIVITAFISPYRSDRDRARESAHAYAPEAFHEIHIAADLAMCESRDPKGLYAKARRGEIKDFTGISAPYEEPDHPELTVDTGDGPLDHCAQVVVEYIERHFTFSGEEPDKH